VLGDSPMDLVASDSESVVQQVEALSYLVQSYICVRGPSPEYPTHVTVMTTHQYHFLHYLHNILEKLMFQVSALDLTHVSKPSNYIQATNLLHDLREQLQSQSVTKSPIPNSVTTSFLVSLAQRPVSSRLPKCFPYACWFLLFGISSFSAFYLALMTLDMTREKATNWLVSILLSLCQSIFVLPPVKVPDNRQ
ncbi:hypothetical protein FKM82_030892, partial [Ascaphus truei]